MKFIKNTIAATLLCSAIITTPFVALSQQKTGFKILANHKIGSSGGWDYITVDAISKRLYVSHGTQVIVLNTAGDSVGVIPNTQGVHGIALIPSMGKGYTSNGRANTVTEFDLKTLKVLGEYPVGQNPDAIFYDEFSKKVITCNGRSKDATVFDPATNKVVATVALGDKPETAVSDGKGKIFVNGETTSNIIVFDASTYKVLTKYKIDGGEAPTGLDIDRKTNRLFIACSDSKTMVIMDAANGKTIAKFPIGDSDGLVFDQSLKLAYASNNEGTISVVRELSADKFEFVENITSQPSARTIGLDQTTHHLFLPAAKTEPNTAGGRPKQVPGSFHVIEVGK
ncbi:YncE family protein [Mucilaginibacter sp. HMF5004]|uniref:YncE family protein n=1 Tax=Mucilaginibacter rivuli TaxID=2857527 RepID=UPI001C602216|nr:YncE family protein [Mucilaginibacter rivuli]MBW4889187.1 YncE family protein [Mucilaginibacter rivuli]